jgi:hypothetical protein
MQEVFSKKKKFHGYLAEGRGFRELDHTKYELEWFGQFICIS